MNQLRWTAIRDILLFAAGLLGAAHEVVLTNTERPTLLILFAAMMGLPAVLRQDAGKGKGGTATLEDLRQMLLSGESSEEKESPPVKTETSDSGKE